MANVVLGTQIDILCLGDDLHVAPAHYDVTRLPWYDRDRDYNTGVPPLAHAVSSRPLSGNLTLLKRGVHLHFRMPSVLTDGRIVTRADNTREQEFPRLPNRWHVSRARGGKRWQVDSDAVRGDESGVTYPLARRLDFQRPYAHIGRQIDITDGPAAPPAQRLADLGGGALTAIGWGDPYFASFYPNCHSIFGLFDPDGQAGDVYTVEGTYSDHDPLQEPGGVEDLSSRLTGPLLVWKDTQWVPWEADTGPATAHLSCRGTATAPNPAPPPSAGDITLTLAHTGTEALATALACKAHGTDMAKRRRFEDQLIAATLAPEIDVASMDHGPLFGEARHQSGFDAHDGGTHWRIVPDKAAQKADARGAETRAPLPDTLAAPLATLNTTQAKLDRETAAIETARQRLFGDWCKYLRSASEEDLDDSPDELTPADLRQVITATSLKALTDLRAACAATLSDRDAARQALDAALSQAGLAYRAEQTVSDRFWRPRDPVVLLTGAAISAVSANRDASDHAYVEDSAATTSAPGEVRPQSTEWTPLIMEWDAAVHPWQSEAPGAAGVPAYPADLLSTQYALIDAAPTDLTRDLGASALRPSPSPVTGRAPLSPHAGADLTDKAEELLVTRAVQDGFFTTDTDGQPLQARRAPSGEERAYVAANHGVLRGFYATAATACPHVSATEAAFLIELINLVYPKDHRVMALSQALAGFNDALLQRVQGFQMPIMDPFALGGFADFAEDVRDALGSGPLLAAKPDGPFQPLRSGAVGIAKLRLIDGFGQFVDLEEPDIDSAQSLTMAGTSVAGPDRGADRGRAKRLLLQPRLTQAARLGFHFVSAGEGATEVFNDHPLTSPILGWIVPDYIDGALQLFDAAGRACSVHDGRRRDDPDHAKRPGLTSEPVAPGLRAVQAWLDDPGGDHAALMDALQEAEDHIDPEGGFAEGDLALLMGRPMAIVRARLKLEYLGAPATSHSWQSLLREHYGGPAETGGVEHLSVPVMLGDRRKLGDGLFGFWMGSAPGVGAALNMPLVTNPKGPHLAAYRPGAPGPLAVSAAGDSVDVTLLTDPLAAVHATTGLLPVSKLRLPQDHVAQALSRLEVTFQTAPILAPDAARVAVPTPVEGGYDWAWYEADGAGFTAPHPPQQPTDAPTFGSHIIARDGWLALRPNDTKQAKAARKDSSP
ncbi:hypothetical protein [Gymnodinialimonas sp.]